MDEQELEATLRAGLASRAEGADVTAPVVARVRDDVSRRRRTRWGVGAAAASVVLVAGGVAAVTAGRDSGGEQPPASDPTAADVAPADVTEWRTEYWADLAVDVPADWGYGGAPYDGGTACYPEAIVGPDGRPLRASGDRGWVGRPIGLTDVCALIPDAWEPTAPYVWLGAVVEPGIVEYDNGYVQETVETHGTTLTVGTADDALRERILGSARVGDLCVPERSTEDTIREGRPRTDSGPDSLRVCVYDASEDGRTARLVYGADLGQAALQQYETALEGAETGAIDACPTLDYASDTWIVLELVDAVGALFRQDVATTQCWLTVAVGADELNGSGDRAVELSPALVEPWAVGGIPATVHGYQVTGREDWLYDYFIGPQG